MRLRSSSPEETAGIARDWLRARADCEDAVVLLAGDLGAGKTVFVRGLAEALGVPPAEVQSPTFVVAREHRDGAGALRLLHLDLYRLTPAEAVAIGVDEMLAGPGLKAVEWPERLGYLPRGAIRVNLRATGDAGEREIEIEDQRE